MDNYYCNLNRKQRPLGRWTIENFNRLPRRFKFRSPYTKIDRNGGDSDLSPEILDTLAPGMNLLGEVAEDFTNKKCPVVDVDGTLVHK